MYQLLIVCPNDPGFIAACNKYARFKRDSGITCIVHPFDPDVQRQSIANLPFLQQQGIDPNLLTDPAACLKVDLLRYYLATKTRYVLLAGDVDRLPTPWFEFIQSGNRYFYPTDLYYADLLRTPGHKSFQTWDPDRDSVKGEFKTTQIAVIDFRPDLSIGRIPASNATELSTAFARLMNRQARTPRCLLLRGNDPKLTPWLEQVSNEAANLLCGRGYSVTHMSIDPAADSSMAQSTLNQFHSSLSNGFEYIFWFGHGGTGSWGSFGPYGLNFSNIVPMTNGSPIVFSMSCNVGQFNRGVYDNQYFSNGVLTTPIPMGSSQIPSVPDSLQPSPSTIEADFAPEEWTVKHPQGATALIAGHSWGSLGSENLSSQVFEFIRGLPSTDPSQEFQYRFVGDVFNRMIFAYLEQYKQQLRTSEVALNHLLRINLFGDPTTLLFS